jgi:WD40 repeat protein
MVALVVCLCLDFATVYPGVATGQITSATIDEVELGYAHQGSCVGFSPNGNLLIVSGNGVLDIGYGRVADIGYTVYDVATGERRFATQSPYTPVISPDEQLLALWRDGIYEVETGQLRFNISGHSPSFSPDSTLVAVGDDGIYDVVTGERRFAIAGSRTPLFSPDGSILAVGDDGVYDVATGQRRFMIAFNSIAFNPDGTLLAVTGEGIYRVSDGYRSGDLPGYDYYDPAFSPDGSLLATHWGVRAVSTGDTLFRISGAGELAFSPDGALLASRADGIYKVSTGELIFEPNNNYSWFAFNQDGSLLAVTNDRIYDVVTWEPRFEQGDTYYFSPDGNTLAVTIEDGCALYGLPEHPWPYRSGLIETADWVNLRRTPAGAIIHGVNGTYPAIARTPDDSWLKIKVNEEEGVISGWVSSSVVRIVSLPSEVPIENP